MEHQESAIKMILKWIFVKQFVRMETGLVTENRLKEQTLVFVMLNLEGSYN